METLKLNFDTTILDRPKTFIVEVPYQDGVVATSKYCPTSFLSGPVDLMAAIRGETLDNFMAFCRSQLVAISKIKDTDNVIDLHIGGLMASIMNRLSRTRKISFGDLLIYVDCFALLLEADGFKEEEIREIYPSVTRTILNLYPDHIEDVPLQTNA
ncbi:MAG: hypothetical protein K2N05_03865 [Muribaculaceae bacterium]|nr:hypothetical protein [Muribaculaceae bacterium]